MPSTTEITVTQLSRLVGLPKRRPSSTCASTRTSPPTRGCCPARAAATFAASRPGPPTTPGKTVIVVCQKGLKLSQGVAAWLRHEGIDAQTLEGGFEAWRDGGPAARAHRQAPAARRAGPHRVGDARAAQGRPHRLPVADPPLRRSRAPCSCSWRRRRSRPWPSASRRRRSTSTACSGAIAATTCTFDTMLEEFGLESAPLLQLATHRARRRHRPARPGAAGGGPARGVARLLAHVPRRPRAARGGHGALRCLLSLVPRRQRRDAQLAVDQGPGLRSGDDGHDAIAAHVRRRRRRRADVRRGAGGLGQDRAHSLRRAGRADRAHAPRAGRREANGSTSSATSRRSTSACCCRGPRRCSSRPTSAGGCTASRAGWRPACCSCCRARWSCSTLSMLYAAFGKLPLAEALFVGVKAAVLAIVVEALLRIARRSLKGNVEWADRRRRRSSPSSSWRCRSR